MGLYLYGMGKAFRLQSPGNAVCAAFLTAVLGFGIGEIVWIPGEITTVLIWILIYFVGEGSKQNYTKEYRSEE